MTRAELKQATRWLLLHRFRRREETLSLIALNARRQEELRAAEQRRREPERRVLH